MRDKKTASPIGAPCANVGGSTAPNLGQVFATEPELILALLETADLTSRDERDQMIAAASTATTMRPRYADVHYCAARVAAEFGENELAAQWVERALALNPRYTDALVLAAKVARRQAQPQAAMERLQRALGQGADYPDVHLLLGELCEELGDPQRAREAYERSLQLNRGYVAARARLGRLTRNACGERKQ